MITPTKNLAAAKGYDVTPPSVHHLSLKGRHPKREAPMDIVAREHDDYHILAPSSVRAEPETLTRAVLEDWSRADPMPPQVTQGSAAASRPAADDRASHTTKRSMRSEAPRASSMQRHMAIRAQMAGQEQQMQLMMAQMKEVMAAVSATDQRRQRIETRCVCVCLCCCRREA